MALTMHQKPGKEERMATWQKCPVCGSPAREMPTVQKKGEYHIGIECLRCGFFTMNYNDYRHLQDTKNVYDSNLIVSISNYIFRNQGTTLYIDDARISKIKFTKVPSFNEKMELFFERIANQNPEIGSTIDLNENDINVAFNILESPSYADINVNDSIKTVFSYLAHCRLYGRREFMLFWLLFCNKKKFLSEGKSKYITPAGWEYIEQLRARNPKSKKAFVAMWFDDNLRSVYEEYISVAVKSCGFKAERVDYVEHNDSIIDKILSNINSSRFVIADFTGNRAGVYYEAGYARGLNIPVIYTCNNSWFHANHSTTITVPINSSSQSVEVKANFGTQIHFDLLQQNFILWENGEDLKEKLINRINATINRPDQI
jgi:nucleoside 2-deoxyribosyltransferase